MTIKSRAYSVLTIKSVNDGERVIHGIATTPTPDRMGDIVEPLGISFKNPLPLLWQHRSSEPVGHVTFEKPTKEGITFTAKIAYLAEPGILKDRLDLAWQSLKLELVKAVSIGFRSLEHAVMKTGGYRFIKSEVMELSLVTIPAQADATINQIRSADAQVRRDLGEPDPYASLPPPGASGPINPPVVRTASVPKTTAEQIAGFELTRTNKLARMDEIMNDSAEKGETLDAAQTEEYDTLSSEVKQIDTHIKRLREHEAMNVSRAVPVSDVRDPTLASQVRAGVSGITPVFATVRSPNLPKGTGFTRYVLAMARARGDIMMACEIAKNNEQWRAETPDVEFVLRSAVAAGTTTDTTWAGPLVQYQNLANEFIEYLRPLTIIGRLAGLRRVPFKVKIPRQTGASSVNWVGEGKVKPLSALAFDSITLDFAKIAGIVPLTEELVRFSNPSAEAIVRDDLANSIVQFMDNEFIDPTNASTDVSPSSITYGVTPVTATGVTGAALRADVKTLMSTFLDSNLSVNTATWIMTQQTALGIALMQNSLGQQEFPGITMNGGTFVGLPVVVSENIPATGGSPTDGFPIVLVRTNDVLLADDGQVTIDASREASLQMDSAPDSPATASTTLVSLWQHNMIAIKAERFINWKLRRSEVVGFIQNAKYAE